MQQAGGGGGGGLGGDCNTKSDHAFVNQSKTKRNISSPQRWFNSGGMEKPKFCETPSLAFVEIKHFSLQARIQDFEMGGEFL